METKEMIKKINKAGYIDIDFRKDIIKLLEELEGTKKAFNRLGNMVIDSIAKAPWMDKTKKEKDTFKKKYFLEEVK